MFDHRSFAQGHLEARNTLEALTVKIFADGADLDSIITLTANPLIQGVTTNPTLMRQAGVADYESFARQLLDEVRDLPVSFEVFADDLEGMENQARAIASWGANVNVKVPVTNTQGQFTGPVIERLSADGVVLNVTAVMTLEQVREVADCLDPRAPAIVSVFAGRIADTGCDPVPVMREAVAILQDRPRAELLWASPRELLNVFQADECGCHIITVTHGILKKLALVGKGLDDYSLDTVKMFYNDALQAGYEIDT